MFQIFCFTLASSEAIFTVLDLQTERKITNQYVVGLALPANAKQV